MMKNASSTPWKLLLAVFALAGCQCGDNLLLVEPVHPGPAVQAARELELFLPRLDTLLEEHAEQHRQAMSMAEAIAQSLILDQLDPRYRFILEGIYSHRGDNLIFLDQNGLTEAGTTVLAALEDSWAHAMKPPDYFVDEARDWVRALSTIRNLIDSYQAPELSEDDSRAIVDYLIGRPDLLDLESERLHQSLADALFDPEQIEHSPLPTFSSVVTDYFRALAAYTITKEQAEIAIAAGFLRYAHDMRYFNPWWYDNEARNDDTLLEGAKREALRQTLLDGCEEGFASVLQRLPPHFEQYGRLLEAHRRYRRIVDEGGWPELEFVNLRRGRSHPMVPELRRRLHIEGYSLRNLDSQEFDNDVMRAITAYQTSHQWRENGLLTDAVVVSMNTSAEYRARQIALALRQWRNSMIGDADYYAFVNIPDFHVEMWRNGNRDMRFRSIVGSTERLVRPNGETEFTRATPVMRRNLRFIVFNPYWNVPHRIMMNEYEGNLAEDPKWYENNGFELMYHDDGTRWVRQLPGPTNPMGMVKFLFPNQHDVYMHDTSQRHLFNRTIRAFSYGCIRIENPFELSDYLLAIDRRWNQERIDQEREIGPDHWVTLRNPVPVIIEYYVTRVADDGVVHFLSDLYWLDRPLMEALEAEELEDAFHRAARQISHSFRAANGCLANPQGEDLCSSSFVMTDDEASNSATSI